MRHVFIFFLVLTALMDQVEAHGVWSSSTVSNDAVSAADGNVQIEGNTYQIDTWTTQELVRETEELNRSALFVKSNTRLVSCDRGVSIPVSVKDGNTSFGGICTTKNPGSHQALVCGDEMVGHFAQEDIQNDNPTDADIAVFIGRYCFGG